MLVRVYLDWTIISDHDKIEKPWFIENIACFHDWDSTAIGLRAF